MHLNGIYTTTANDTAIQPLSLYTKQNTDQPIDTHTSHCLETSYRFGKISIKYFAEKNKATTNKTFHLFGGGGVEGGVLFCLFFVCFLFVCLFVKPQLSDHNDHCIHSDCLLFIQGSQKLHTFAINLHRKSKLSRTTA